jgi:hypothetical protein
MGSGVMDDLRFHIDHSVEGTVHFVGKAADMVRYNAVVIWCISRFGEAEEIQQVTDVPKRWAYYPYAIVLTQPDDIMEFRLRWT